MGRLRDERPNLAWTRQRNDFSASRFGASIAFFLRQKVRTDSATSHLTPPSRPGHPRIRNEASASGASQATPRRASPGTRRAGVRGARLSGLPHQRARFCGEAAALGRLAKPCGYPYDTGRYEPARPSRRLTGQLIEHNRHHALQSPHSQHRGGARAKTSTADSQFGAAGSP